MLLAEDAHAKINLHLHVVGRRADGYHLLDSLVVFAGVHDRIEVQPAPSLSLTIDGPFAAGLQAEPDNLVLRAARALAASAAIAPGASVRLTKMLPVASGIGGGSADAAATLRALSRLWSVPIPDSLPARLGADVPVCMAGRPCRMEGVGEILSPAPALPPCGIVLVNPGVALSTQAVFRARQAPPSPRADLPEAWQDARAMATALARLANDLQPPAETLCPPVTAVLSALAAAPDCLLARMSGSGATCFGLFETPALAEAAASALSSHGWWCWGGGWK